MIDVRPLGALAAGLLLVGCTGSNVKPQPYSATAERNDRACVTGTRISSSEPCSAPGRVYTDKDIQNTGATSAADALRLLDPSITVSR
jgi:outer membrane cobalamin receptor